MNKSKVELNKLDKNNATQKLETDKINSTPFEWKNIHQKEVTPAWKNQKFLHLQPLETENQDINYKKHSFKSKSSQKNKKGIVRNLFFSIGILFLITLLMYYK